MRLLQHPKARTHLRHHREEAGQERQDHLRKAAPEGPDFKLLLWVTHGRSRPGNSWIWLQIAIGEANLLRATWRYLASASRLLSATMCSNQPTQKAKSPHRAGKAPRRSHLRRADIHLGPRRDCIPALSVLLCSS